MSVQIKDNLLTWRCRAGSSSHFDIIYVALTQFVMTQFNMAVVTCLITMSIIRTPNLEFQFTQLINSDISHFLIRSNSNWKTQVCLIFRYIYVWRFICMGYWCWWWCISKVCFSSYQNTRRHISLCFGLWLAVQKALLELLFITFICECLLAEYFQINSVQFFFHKEWRQFWLLTIFLYREKRFFHRTFLSESLTKQSILYPSTPNRILLTRKLTMVFNGYND